MQAYANNPQLPLSRLVCWNQENDSRALVGSYIYCSVPLIDSAGRAFGVCGIGISQRGFMLRDEPNLEMLPNLVVLVAENDNQTLNLTSALLSGNNAEYADMKSGGVSVSPLSGNLSELNFNDSRAYVGICKDLTLYPSDSPFYSQRISVVGMIPKSDFTVLRTRQIIIYALISTVLAATAVIVSVVLSKRYVKPITDTIENIAQGTVADGQRTNIKEIDALIEKLLMLHSSDNPIPENLFEDFIGKTKSLTRAELTILRFHIQGKSTEQIVGELFISPETLKRHNNHIFKKMNVQSKNELVVYGALIEQCGLLSEIFPED